MPLFVGMHCVIVHVHCSEISGVFWLTARHDPASTNPSAAFTTARFLQNGMIDLAQDADHVFAVAICAVDHIVVNVFFNGLEDAVSVTLKRNSTLDLFVARRR